MHRSLSPAALLACGLIALSAIPALAADPSPAASAAASAAPAGVPLEGTTWQLTNLRLSGAYAPIPPTHPRRSSSRTGMPVVMVAATHGSRTTPSTATR